MGHGLGYHPQTVGLHIPELGLLFFVEFAFSKVDDFFANVIIITDLDD
jgi:hypothetical protein